jgi:hypothetical protein
MTTADAAPAETRKPVQTTHPSDASLSCVAPLTRVSYVWRKEVGTSAIVGSSVGVFLVAVAAAVGVGYLLVKKVSGPLRSNVPSHVSSQCFVVMSTEDMVLLCMTVVH